MSYLATNNCIYAHFASKLLNSTSAAY